MGRNDGPWLAFIVLSVVGLGCRSSEGNPAHERGDADEHGLTDAAAEIADDGGLLDTAIDVACVAVLTSTCVSACLEESWHDSPVCINGVWTCPAGLVAASSCPADGCGVTPRFCCNAVTGSVTNGACGADGRRVPCETGPPTYSDTCIPPVLETDDCGTLDGQSCSGPALRCRRFVRLPLFCHCEGADAGAGIWKCVVFLDD